MRTRGVVALAAALIGVLPAHASTAYRLATIGDLAESWYWTTPASACTSPVGCPPLAPTNPFPGGTLQVAVAAGQPAAIAFVQPDLAALPLGATDLTGSMTLPVSTDPRAGNVAAASATIRACLATEPLTDGVEGSTDAPPGYDCRIDGALETSSAGDAFTLDLGPFLRAWSTGLLEFGIALIPTPSATQWSVAFNGKTLTPHVGSVISYLPPPAGEEVVAPGDQSPSAPASVAPPAIIPTPTPAATTVPVAAPSASIRRIRVEGGFRYSAVMLLPLVLLIATAFLARTLTRDLTPSRRA